MIVVLLSLNSIAKKASDVRFIILLAAMLIGGGYWLRPVVMGYQDVIQIKKTTHKNKRKVIKNRNRIEDNEEEIKDVNIQIKKMREAQNETVRSVDRLNRNLRIIECTKDEISDRTHARLNCSEFD